MAKYAKCANCGEEIEYGEPLIISGVHCFCSEECFIYHHGGDTLYEGVDSDYDEWFEDDGENE